MNKIEVIAKLKEIVKPYVQDQNAFENLTESTDFINDLKINSANLVDIILDVEEILNLKATIEVIETKLSEK